MTLHVVPQYRPLLAERRKSLDVPFSLHPRPPLVNASPLYECDTPADRDLNLELVRPTPRNSHALGLIGNEPVRRPIRGCKSLLGHLGEVLPSYSWRIAKPEQLMKAAHKYPPQKRVGGLFLTNSISHDRAIFSARPR